MMSVKARPNTCVVCSLLIKNPQGQTQIHRNWIPLRFSSHHDRMPLLLLFLSLPSFLSVHGSTEQVTGGELTELQKHVSFFDRNHDGILYPNETSEGFRAIGFSAAVSKSNAAAIHAALSPITLPPGKAPSSLLPIYVENIAKAKHGSDTGAYDSEGRFVPEKFEEIFQKHAHINPNALTPDEVAEMLKANRNDTAGGEARSLGEWKLLSSIAKDKDGLFQKETVRTLYDGSLFVRLENEASSQK